MPSMALMALEMFVKFTKAQFLGEGKRREGQHEVQDLPREEGEEERCFSRAHRDCGSHVGTTGNAKGSE